MQDKPRYSRVSDILDLAIFMQSKSLGITISDIMERYNVSRRTAERMRDSLLNIFSSIDEISFSKPFTCACFFILSSKVNSLIYLVEEFLKSDFSIFRRNFW